MVNRYTDADSVSAILNGVTISGTTTPSDDQVDAWIAQASNELEVMTGRIWTSTTASSVILDYDGSGYLRLPKSPVISISSLEYNKQGLGSSSSEWTSLTEGRTNDFIFYSDEGEVQFFGSNTPPAGQQRIRVSYTYGYASTPLWVEKLCAQMVARRFIASVVQGDAKEQGGSITVGNITISDPSTFSASFLRQLDTEIEDTLGKFINQTHVFRPSRSYSSR